MIMFLVRKFVKVWANWTQQYRQELYEEYLEAHKKTFEITLTDGRYKQSRLITETFWQEYQGIGNKVKIVACKKALKALKSI